MSGTTTPVVHPGTDPLLLMRVHPEAESFDDAEAAAVLQGEETAAAGAEQQASQQVPGAPPEQPPVDIPPPVNKDVPYLSQTGSTLNCTMGNWVVTPDSYSYQWLMDGVAAGPSAGASYDATFDVGKTATCIVTATNAGGSTAAPPSNAVVIA